MGSISSVQDLDNFLSSPLKKQQPGQSAMAVPPAVVPKKPLHIQSVQDLDAFIKAPLANWDLRPSRVTQFERESSQLGKLIPEAATKPLTLAQKYAVEPFEKMAAKGAEGGRQFATEVMGTGEALAHLPTYLGASLPSPYGPKAPMETPEQAVERKHPVLTGVARGAGATAGGMLADPRQWPFFLEGSIVRMTGKAVSPLLSRLVTSGFTAQMGYGTATGVKDLAENWDRMSPAQRAEAITSAGIGGAFTVLGFLHAAKENPDSAEAKKVNEAAQGAFGKKFTRLDPNQQAEVLYGLAKEAKAPISMDVALRMVKSKPQLTLLPEAQEMVEQQQRARRESTADLERRGVQLRQMQPPPETYSPEKRPSRVPEYYELPETPSTYLSPEERASQYYTLESARTRLDEERKRQANIDDKLRSAEAVRERERVDRRQQAEGEAQYRAVRSGKTPVVTERRGLQFDVEGAERNREEFSRLTGELDRVAQEHMYLDSEDMIRSLDTQKGRGRELEEWQRNVLDLDLKRKEVKRMADPRSLAPKRTEVFAEMREDANKAVREQEMRDAAEKIKNEAKNIADPEEAEKLNAEAEEARDRAETIKTERDKAMAARAAQTAERQVYPLGVAMSEVRGREGELILPDRRRLKFHYAVVPLSELILSHDPASNFEPTEEYPEVLQPRDYKNNRETQAGVIAGGANPEPSLVISDAATAHEGPPVVRADGVVAGGNGRSMRMKLAFKNGHGEDLAGYLAMKADQFGIDSERLPPTGEQPVLVRVLDEPFEGAEDLARLGRDLNRTETMGFSESENAVTAGRAISNDTLDWVTNALDAMGDEASLRDFMRRRGNEVVGRMVNSGMIEPTKRAEFITPDGEMTEKAKDLFEAALLGKVVDDPALLATTPKDILRKLERSIASLARIKDAGGLWDITPELKRALSLWKRVDSVRESLNLIGAKDDSLVDRYLHPGDYKMGTDMLIDARDVPHPTVEALAKLLEEPSAEVKRALTEYSNDAEGKQATLGPAPNPVESFNRFISERVGVEVPPDLWGVLQAEARREPVPESAEAVELERPTPEGKVAEPLPPSFGGASEASVRDFLEQHPGTRDVAQPLMDAMGAVVKNALGIDLDRFLKQNWADVRAEGEPGSSALGQDIAKLSSWARGAGKRLTIAPFGEQMGLFGGAEKQFLLRRGTGIEAQEAMALQSQLRELRELVPRVRELTDEAGNLIQSKMFDEPPTLGAPEDEPELPLQPNLLFQEKQSSWLYKSEVVLSDDKLPAAQSGAQWSAMLRNKGVKAEELKWMGIDDFLQDKKKVTRDELLGFVRENQLQVQEVVLGTPGAKSADDWAHEEYGAAYDSLDPHQQAWVNRMTWEGDLPPSAQSKYSQYTLPGPKKGYAEVLFTLPVEKFNRGRLSTGPVEAFSTSHFSEVPNVVAHVRFDERTDADGRRVLFVEEVQSDWHQKGKREGYRETGDRDRVHALRVREEALRSQGLVALRAEDWTGFENPRDALYDAARVANGEAGSSRWKPETLKAAKEWRQARDEWDRAENAMVRGVANAPFKSDWHELVMKRMLREAAERGFDKIAWTTGEQTADRYNLAKHVDGVGYKENPGNTYSVFFKRKGETDYAQPDNRGMESVSKDQLPEIVGKELATKIIDGTGHKLIFKPGTSEVIGRGFEGLDLKIGGEWAKALYDRAIPNFLNKYGKKWGARVGEIELQSQSAARGVRLRVTREGLYEVEWRNNLSDQAHTETFVDTEEARKFVEELRSQKGVSVHGLDITSEMRRSVMEGQPLFQQKKGATEFLEDGRAIVYLFKNADASTFVHEFFHTMRRYLKPEDMKVLEDWAKVKEGRWSRDHEEKAARAFEYYHREAKPSTLPDKVRAVFVKIQSAMREIYAALKGSPLVKPSKEVSALFDRWYGREMEPPPVEGKKVAKPAKEKIQPAAEMDAPPVSAEEREGAIPIGKAGSPLDTGKIRTKIFRDYNQAKDWAFTNQQNIKGAELSRLSDGRVVVDFAAKKDNVLFQVESGGEQELMKLNARLEGLNKSLMRVMPEGERIQISRQIRDVTERRNTLQSKRQMRSLEPPPGQVVTLWTPEGERPLPIQPREELRGTQTASNVVRTVFNEPPAVREFERPPEVRERAKPSGVSRAEPSTGRGVSTAGRGEERRGGTGEPRSALRDVNAIRVAEPLRPRGEAAYHPQEWEQKVKDYRLPENAPAPTVRIPKEISRMLMPGQTEIVESVLSGLKQHDAYILATTTGTGKSFMSSAVLQQKLAENPNARILYLTPSQGLIHGDDGIIQVANNFGVKVQPMPAGEVPQEPGVWAATWASMLNRPEIEKQPWDLVVADEVQEARRWFAESQRGQKMKEMAGNAKQVLYMSATPFHTSLEIGHMDKLGLWADQGFEQWARQLGVYRDSEGNLAGGRAPLKLAKLRQQLVERGQMVNIDRNMEGYSSHFGVVPMDGATAQGLDNIARAMQIAENYFQSMGRLGKIRPTRAQSVTLAKRWLEWQRLPHAIELAKKLEKQGWKTIIFSENKKEFNEIFEFLKEADEGTGGQISRLLPKFGSIPERLQEAFGDDVAIFAGPHSAIREGEKNSFMSNRKKHLYATYGAGGVGVSLHDKMGDYPRAVIYLGPPWSGVSFDQALGRPWRYGTKSNVRAYFLFSNSAAEMDIVTNKVAPRMESLRALVSGVDFEDPIVKNLRDVPENKEAALDYDLGNEHKASLDSLRKISNRSGVTNYAELPIVSAEEAKQKGMRLPGDTGAGAPSLVRLWQGGTDEEITPPEFDAPEVTRARAANVSIGEGFIKSGAAPGRVDLRELTPPQRRMIADTVMATAEAATRENPAGATQAVYAAWENAMKQIDAFMSAQKPEESGMKPPPGEPPKPVEVAEGGEPPTPPGEIGGLRALDMYMFTNGRDVVRNAAEIAGVPKIGYQISRNIEQYHVRNGEIAGPWSQRFWKLLSDNKLSKDEFKVAALTLAQREDAKPWMEKEIQRLRATAPMNERIAKVVDGMANLYGDVFKRLANDDIYTRVYDAVSGKPRDVYFRDQKGGPYWPRRYDYDEKHTVVDPETGKEISFTLRELTKHEGAGEARQESIVRGMMERHGLSRTEVEDWLASKRRQVPLAGNIERARQADLPFFRTDPDVVVQYLEDAAELLSRKEYFGQDGSKVSGLIAQIPDQKARKITQGVVDSLLSRSRMEPESRMLIRAAADWSVLSKMTFSAIKVLGHPAHGALLTNTRSFLRGLLKATFDYRSAREQALFAGSINEQVKIEQLAEFGIQKKSLASRFLRATLWQSAYKWGRVAADATARVWMESYALPKLLEEPENQRIRRQLREFLLLDDARIDRAVENRRWLRDDVNWGAKALSDKVMFTNDPTELPPAWRARSTEPVQDSILTAVRTLTLLKGYQFKTHALLKDAIWDEAKRGNFRPLIPFLTVYPVLGQLIWSLTAIATVNQKHFKKLMADDAWEPGKALVRYVDDIAHMIGDSSLMAFLEAYLGGKRRLAGDIGGEYIMSPGASDLARTIMLPSDVIAAKTPQARYKAGKRWAEETFPGARPLENLYNLSLPQQGNYGMAPPPYPH